MSSPEHPSEDSDPTLRHLDDILHTMGGEHLGSAAVSGAAHEEVEGPLPLLPSTPNDVKWEALHGGEVSLINCADEDHLGGVIKVYRSPSCEAGYILKPPLGPEIQISPKDIVQIFPRDKHGNMREHPSFIFQGTENVPGDYTLTLDGKRVRTLDEEIAERAKLPKDSIIITDNLSDPEHIMGERLEADNTKLRILSSLFNNGGRIRPDYTLDDDTTLVWYPLNGKPFNVVTPAGDLIKGHRNDIVEIVQTHPDASRTPLRRATLGKLAQEDGYMIIEES